MTKLRVLDCFSGIGGFSLGLERTGGFETIAFCEIDPFCRKVLRKHWPDVSIYEDVRTLNHDGPVDVITGGYPCQPFSLAGKRGGAEDGRHLWPAMFSLIEKHRPDWIIGENVFGHISMGLDEVLSDLEAAGYTTRPFVIPACAVDAPHRRDRVWVVANHGISQSMELPGSFQESGNRVSNSSQTMGDPTKPGPLPGPHPGIHSGEESAGPRHAEPKRRSESLADARRQRHQEPGSFGDRECSKSNETGTANEFVNGGFPNLWPVEPNVGRVAHGIPRRVDGSGLDDNKMDAWPPEPLDVPRVAPGVKDRVGRLRALGNAVVPQVVEALGRAVLEAENERM